MPEGPEVFRIGAELRERISGTILKSIALYNKEAEDINAKVLRVITKGKRLVIILDDDVSVLISFALSGELVFGSSNVVLPGATVATAIFVPVEKLPARRGGDKPLHVSLNDPQHLALFLYDGTRRLINSHLPLGFDPLHTISGMREWLSMCQAHPGQYVANFITNQEIICGVGNRYRSEIMHLAQIPPDARVRELSLDQAENLLIATYRILKCASRGKYQYAVYGKKESFPEGNRVFHTEIAKGVFIWSIFPPKKGQK